ncbi:hypothetical protein [Silanimonas sp.]|jgi:hypothetical protein|uniref:hypothetical protein n=1 Tax=Silanimonas sp. TaxID=1929290 RepID=UPI0037C6E5C0
MRHSAPLLALALFTVTGAAAAQGFSTVEERMSATEFREAGLDTLSEAQLQALNAWLQRDRRCVAADAAMDSRGLRPEALDDEADIISTLPGAFTGWQGGEVFTLANGQVWRAIDPGSALRGVNLTNPRVTISKGLFGAWRLKVEGYNASVKVERVE